MCPEVEVDHVGEDDIGNDLPDLVPAGGAARWWPFIPHPAEDTVSTKFVGAWNTSEIEKLGRQSE